MKVTEDKLLLDSNIWLGYLVENNPETKAVIESHQRMLYCSVVSVYEISKILGQRNYSVKGIHAALTFIRENATLLDVTEPIALHAAHYAKQNRLHTADSLIYATAIQEDALLITADRHFDGLEQTRLIRPQ